MKKTILFIFIIISLSLPAAAGARADYVISNDTVPAADRYKISEAGTVELPSGNQRRWFFGGGLGFGWGSDEWSLHVSPQVGYRVTDYFNVGGGLSYSFYKINGLWGDLRVNMFGVNGFTELYLARWAYLFAQPEVVYQWWNYLSYGYRDHIDPIFCMPVGVGFVIPTGRSGIVISLYYDVIQNRYSPYGSNLGCSVGFLFRRR